MLNKDALSSVNITHIVMKSNLAQDSSAVEVNDIVNVHGGYWNENPKVHIGISRVIWYQQRRFKICIGGARL